MTAFELSSINSKRILIGQTSFSHRLYNFLELNKPKFQVNVFVTTIVDKVCLLENSLLNLGEKWTKSTMYKLFTKSNSKYVLYYLLVK